MEEVSWGISKFNPKIGYRRRGPYEWEVLLKEVELSLRERHIEGLGFGLINLQA